MRQCKGCGATFASGELRCPYCGTPLVPDAERSDDKNARRNRARQETGSPSGGVGNAFREQYRRASASANARGYDQESPPPLNIFGYDRVQMLIATILAWTLGLFGIHWFYLGRPDRAKWYLIFFWTGIPYLVAIVDGVSFLRRLITG